MISNGLKVFRLPELILPMGGTWGPPLSALGLLHSLSQAWIIDKGEWLVLWSWWMHLCQVDVSNKCQ